MSRDVLECQFVKRGQLIQFLPKINIFDRLERLPLFAPPAVLFPFRHPILDSLQNIFRITDKFHLTRLGQGFQPFDDSEKFHTVVRRVGFAAKPFERFSALGML